MGGEENLIESSARGSSRRRHLGDLIPFFEKRANKYFELASNVLRYRLRIQLGSPLRFGTPAYWIYQSIVDEARVSYQRTERSLIDETVFCMLGGFGIKAETAIRYYNFLKDENVLEAGNCSEEQIESLLRTPMIGENKKVFRYRFPKQKAKRIANIISVLSGVEFDCSDAVGMRNRLCALPGIGPKTASWIVRNHLNTKDIAVIDIHLTRACVIAGVFHPLWRVERDYFLMEHAFLGFARKFKIDPRNLDLLMWNQMREIGTVGLKLYERPKRQVK